jgi:hypothetical protein
MSRIRALQCGCVLIMKMINVRGCWTVVHVLDGARQLRALLAPDYRGSAGWFDGL